MPSRPRRAGLLRTGSLSSRAWLVGGVVASTVAALAGAFDARAPLVAALAAAVASFSLAAWRSRRDRLAATSGPRVLDPLGLRLALDAAQMGTWRWDVATDRVEWDDQLHALFGLEPGTFAGTLAAYEALLHPDDRARVIAAVEDGMRRDAPWRFDHRVTWPDGTVHWLEGHGEPIHDASGAIVGATGVTVNVDQRHALLDAQTRAREAAERVSVMVQHLADISSALAAASTVDEVGQVIVERAAAALRARSGYFATVDEASGDLVLRAQIGHPRSVVEQYGRVSITAAMPATEAVRTGRPVFIESPDDWRARFPQYREDPAHAAFAVVPLSRFANAPAVLAFGFAEPRRFPDEDRRYIATVVETCSQALQRATAFEAEQAARQNLRTVLDFSEQLGALDDPDLVVDAIARIAANHIGTWATVVVVRPGGHAERIAEAHREPDAGASRPSPARAGGAASPDHDENALQRAIDTGEPILVSNAADAPGPTPTSARDDATRASRVFVPLTTAGRRLAMLVIGDDRPGGLRATDVELAIDLGRRGATALERAQLWQSNRARLEAEHRIVELLQHTVVPEHLPRLRGLRVAAAYRPAEVEVDVGGDWYDAFVAPDGSVVVVVGDVAGHGVEAASLMGRARNALRAYAIEDADPATILSRLHRLLRTFDEFEMVTAFVGRLEPRTSLLSWARAGHPPPVLVGPDGTTRFLDEVNAPPLGTVSHEFASAETELRPGSLLVCYTDGLIERRDRALDAGFEWLARRVRELAHEEAEAVCEKLVGDPFVAHPAPDDICVLVLRTDAT
jgi:serine phosphatase RsbU (regulator of sigma subunit)/PAS domain-containing protein